jgi:phosphonopyruvate decarboxylase
MLVGWRGEPGKKDEVQHKVQGNITAALLKDIGIAHTVLPDYDEGAADALQLAYSYMNEYKAPFALLVKRQNFEKYAEPVGGSFVTNFQMPREEALTAIVDTFTDAATVTTTGFSSREIYELREMFGQGHQQDFLTVGAMGHSSSIALGVALGQPEKQVVCIDGDGSALMHLGAFKTIGDMGPENLKHVVINNGMHDSVGGQPTQMLDFDFPAFGKACGYRSVASVETRDDVHKALLKLRDEPGPALLEIKVRGGARLDLGRPSISPKMNKVAFMDFLGANGDFAEHGGDEVQGQANPAWIPEEN